LIWKRKKNRNPKEIETEKKPEPGISATEKAYLEQLEKMISSPKLSPYLQRKRAKSKNETHPAAQPTAEVASDKNALEEMRREAIKNAASTTPKTPSPITRDGRVRLGPDGVFELEIDIPRADLEQYEDLTARTGERQPLTTPETSEEEPETPQPEPEEKQPEQPRPEKRASVAPKPQEAGESRNLFPPGTLVVWDNSQLAIYKEHLENKGYDLLYVVEPDGRLEPKGVCLFAYEHKRVGQLSEGILNWMERNMRWEREALLYHFDNPAEAQNLAAFKTQRARATRPSPAADGESPEDRMLVRGRTFTINFGERQWSGIYWGRDKLGTIVAHNTNRTWNLMHLDLKRFGSSIAFGDVLPDEQIREIEKALE